jgi:hypothetical protein
MRGGDRRLGGAEAAVAITALVLIGLGVSRLFFPYDIGEFEANAWAPALLLAHLHNPYAQSLALSPPYTASAYGPLYYLIIGVGLRVFGYQFWFARLLSICAALLAASMAFRISARFAGGRGPGLLTAALVLAQWPVMTWVGVQRPDLIALGLTLVALDLALRRRQQATPRQPALAAALLVAALLTRQTYVLPAVLVVAWYAAGRRGRELLLFALTYLGLAAAVIIWLTASSHGGLIASLFSNQGHAAQSFAQLGDNIKGVLESPASWCVVLGVAVVASGSLRHRDAGDQEVVRLVTLLLGYTVLATALALLTSARAGANINYYIEPLTAGALTVGVGWTLLPAGSGRLIGGCAALLIVAGALEAGVRQGHGQIYLWRGKPYLNAVVARLRQIPRSAGPMFSIYPELVVDSGHIAWINDFVQYDGRSAEQRRTYSRLLASGRLAAIVWGSTTSPPGYIAASPGMPHPNGVYPVNLYVRRGLREAG